VNVLWPADPFEKEANVEPADRAISMSKVLTLRVHSGGFVLAEYDVRVAIKR